MPLLLIGAAIGLSGCGEGEEGGFRDQARDRIAEVRTNVEREVEDLKARARKRIERIRERIRETLGELEQTVPEAQETKPDVQTRGRSEEGTIDAFLTDVLEDVDAYWTETFAASELPEPKVKYAWIPPGETFDTPCEGAAADDEAAFYCPADDTIYIAQKFAADLYDAVVGEGRSAGDFGVAYVVAHEYAHNLQDELDLFTLRASNSTKPFELQADCLAGAWGNSVYEDGLLEDGDVEEAMDTARALGDFDVSDANHHGTPDERRAAWKLGFDRGDPSVCERYLPPLGN